MMWSKKFFSLLAFLLFVPCFLFSQTSGNGSPEVSSQSFLESVTRLNDVLTPEQKQDLKIILRYYRNLLETENDASTKDSETLTKLSESWEKEKTEAIIAAGSIGFAIGLASYWIASSVKK